MDRRLKEEHAGWTYQAPEDLVAVEEAVVASPVVVVEAASTETAEVVVDLIQVLKVPSNDHGQGRQQQRQPQQSNERP